MATKTLTPKMREYLAILADGPNTLYDERTAAALKRRGLIESCGVPNPRLPAWPMYGWRLTDAARALLSPSSMTTRTSETTSAEIIGLAGASASATTNAEAYSAKWECGVWRTARKTHKCDHYWTRECLGSGAIKAGELYFDTEELREFTKGPVPFRCCGECALARPETPDA